MKKHIALLLVFVLLLTGCHMPGADTAETKPNSTGTQPDAPILEETTDAPVQSESPKEYQQQTMLAVSMPQITQLTTTENGTTVFRFAYQTMQLILQEPEVADAIIVDYLNRIDSAQDAVSEAAATAEAQHSGQEDWSEHFYDICYSPTRIDQGVLSLSGTTLSYAGGRPTQICTAANYNMLTGEVLTLGSILYHIDAKDALEKLVIEAADTLHEVNPLYDDYAAYISDRFEREESYDEDWYFTQTGLCFYFSPYEIAPYAAGIVTLEVPYAQLSSVIADEFFPPEEDLLEGTLQVEQMQNADMTAYSQISEVILNTDGEHFLLSADGALRDIRIDVGTWDESGTFFTPGATVFASATLTPGDAVMIQDMVPDTMPQIRISYRSGYETHTAYLSQSGEDGSPLLIEN